jgi:hypothetical protein
VRWRRLLWLVVSLPALAQLAVLFYAVVRRLAYPYDLEWMEGGMLNHALRLAGGQGIYVPPSVDFIPYLYTPLYPWLLAVLGKAFGLSYALGRAVSFVSMAAVVALGAFAVAREAEACRRPLGLAAAAMFAGFYAATYPWVEGWYDLVRGDTLQLALGVGGLVALFVWARRPALVAVAAALIATSFFAKQTGVLFVAAGGAALLGLNWRAVPIYVAVAGAIGGGGSYLLNRATDGWYWIYVFQVHQQHDTNVDRFIKSFGYELGHFPALTAVVLAGLVAVAWRRREPPPSARAFLYWSFLFVCGSVIGAIGWSTQWAHWNAYIPAMTFGAIAAGLGLIVVFESLGVSAAAVAALALAANLGVALWSPRRFIPTPADRAAGDRLVARIAAEPGEVFIPSHPWYAHLAGKRTYTHRMGLLDVTFQGAGKKPLPPRARVVEGLPEALKGSRFGAIILDDKEQLWELPGLTEGYHPDEALAGANPRVLTGAPTTPRMLWIPRKEPPPPPGTKIVFDFEAGTFAGWEVTGDAWGAAPVTRVPGRDVAGTRGRFFASSNAIGDRGTGTILSPPFVLSGQTLSLRVAGGNAKGVRAELRDALTGEVLRTATGEKSLVLRVAAWPITDLRGRTVRLAGVDEEKGSWGVLFLDDVREIQ